MRFVFTGIGIVVAVMAIAVARAAVFGPREVDGWAASRRLALDAENRSLVWWYLRTARTLRTLGVLAGLVLPWLASQAFGIDLGTFGGWAYAFLGYLLGAVYAEVALVRAPRGRASLQPRRLPDYLPRHILVLQRAFAAVVVAVGVLGWLVLRRSDPVHASRWLLAAAVAGVALPVILEAIQRWLVTRPQPLTSPSLLAADDAIRSQSVHSVAGAGMALETTVLAGAAYALAASDVQWLRWASTIPSMLLPLVGLLLCLHYGHRAWGVRRAQALTGSRAAW